MSICECVYMCECMHLWVCKVILKFYQDYCDKNINSIHLDLFSRVVESESFA